MSSEPHAQTWRSQGWRPAAWINSMYSGAQRPRSLGRQHLHRLCLGLTTGLSRKVAARHRAETVALNTMDYKECVQAIQHAVAINCLPGGVSRHVCPAGHKPSAEKTSTNAALQSSVWQI